MSDIIKDINELITQIQNSCGDFKFKIKVVANSKNNSIEFLEEFIKIKIKDRALEGKANKAVIEYLSDILNISKSKISISFGEKSSLKIIKVVK